MTVEPSTLMPSLVTCSSAATTTELVCDAVMSPWTLPPWPGHHALVVDADRRHGQCAGREDG
eukprot:683766-Prymnesium_polylepis.1